MRRGIRPVHRPVVFRDRASGLQPLTRSAPRAPHTVEWGDGAPHPVVDVETSSTGHPFRTGHPSRRGHRGTRGALRTAYGTARTRGRRA